MCKLILILSIMICQNSLLSMGDFFKGYRNTGEFNQSLKNLKHAHLKTTVLARTLAGNDILLLTLNKGGIKPALFIIGDTKGDIPVGSEVLYYWLKNLIGEDNAQRLDEILAENTLYIIPRPAPDALRHFFGKVQQRSSLNSRKVDDDKDLQINEDAPEDLNGDGVVTFMRVQDENGAMAAHPDMPQLMIPATKKDQMKYRVISEGIDNDKDELFNEDGYGGVDFNRNFTFRYPYFKIGAGPHQVSEIETRALADFAFNHPEIFMVISFGEEDNLKNRWKVNPKQAKARIKTSVLKDDAVLFEDLSKTYEKFFKGKVRKQGSVEGSFAHWAYFHFGRLSLSLRPWSIPIDSKGKITDKRQEGRLRELLWLKKNRPQALLPWTALEHPDFPGEKVQIGGVKPFYDVVPPYEECQKKGVSFGNFIAEVLKSKNSIVIEKEELENSGQGFYRLKFTVKNKGSFPTSAQVGRLSRRVHPLNVHVELPPGWKFYKGYKLTQINLLKAHGKQELEYLLIGKAATVSSVKVKVVAPQIINVEKEIKEVK